LKLLQGSSAYQINRAVKDSLGGRFLGKQGQFVNPVVCDNGDPVGLYVKSGIGPRDIICDN
jgi:hypothetical protein